MNWSGFIVGIILTLGGLVLMGVSIFSINEVGGKWVMSIYGIILLVIGVYMLYNHEKEDKIELIKKIKRK